MIENKILKDIKFALMSKNVETANKLRSILSTFNGCKSKTSKRNDDVVAMEMCIAELTDDGNFELAEIAKNYVTADVRKILVEKYADDILNDIKGIFNPEDFMSLLTEKVCEKWNLKLS